MPIDIIVHDAWVICMSRIVHIAFIATRGHWFWGDSTTPRGRGFLLLGYFWF